MTQPSLPPLRIVFMGTAPLACPVLQTMVRDPSLAVQAVVTQPDRPKGRTLKCQPSAVKQTALALGLPVVQPEKARQPAFVEELRNLKPDLIVVAAYGQILPQAMLDIPPYGCLNVHASLLPKYRGAAPIQWAILNGDSETGVTIMRLDAGLDTGDIVAQETMAITPDDTAQTLHDRLADQGARLLKQTLRPYVTGAIIPRPQPAEGACYARKITKNDGLIHWTQPARLIGSQIRALTPWPGAFTFWPGQPGPRLLKIWRAEVAEAPAEGCPPGTMVSSLPDELVVVCGEQALRIVELQLEGGKRLETEAFLAGHPLGQGIKLEGPAVEHGPSPSPGTGP